MPHVELERLSKQFGAVEVIRDLSLAVEAGEFCALLGPSGCGKSTLLRMIAGLETVTSGQRPHRRARRHPGAAGEAPHLDGVPVLRALPAHDACGRTSASASTSPAPRSARSPRSPTRSRALLQLGELMDRKPAQLSGGQRQRVAIGRALVRDPEVFLFDEPLSNLDAKLRVQMRLELAKLHQELATTMIYVTHDQVEAMTLADRIVVLDRGRIAQIGTPLDLYHRPENKFVASFIGSPAMNFVPATVPAASRTAAPRPQRRRAERHPVAAGRRPAPARAAASSSASGPSTSAPAEPGGAAAVLDGRISMLEHLGHTTILYVDTAGRRPDRRGRRRIRRRASAITSASTFDRRARPPVRRRRPRPVTMLAKSKDESEYRRSVLTLCTC